MADIEKDITSDENAPETEAPANEAEAKPAADPLAKIEWGAMSGSLDFLDEEAPKTEDARVEKLQALAKSVAKATTGSTSRADIR